MPQLETILRQQGRSQSWLLKQLGMHRQTWHNNEDAGGWPDVDVPQIAAVLGVSVEVLKARGAMAPNAMPTVQTLLARPELARVTDDAMESVRQQMEQAVTHAVTETVRLLATGAVPMPSAVPTRPSIVPRRGSATDVPASLRKQATDAHATGRRLPAKRGR